MSQLGEWNDQYNYTMSGGRGGEIEEILRLMREHIREWEISTTRIKALINGSGNDMRQRNSATSETTSSTLLGSALALDTILSSDSIASHG